MLKELMEGAELKLYQLGLNPYFNGTCSKSYLVTAENAVRAVLILILMEHAQRVIYKKRKLWKKCLNPYFNGTCSKRSNF